MFAKDAKQNETVMEVRKEEWNSGRAEEIFAGQ